MNSLVPFTFLVQLALGAAALAAMAPLRAAAHGDASHLVLRLLYVAAAALVVASACSLQHLGVKSGALRALRNLRTSWLSREVLFTGLFTALTLASATLETLGYHGTDLLWLVTLTGFAAVFTMSRLYQATIAPAWATPYTPISFFATAVLAGVALGAPLVQLDGRLPAATAGLLLRDIILTGAVAGALSLAATAVYAREYGERALPLAARLLLLIAGLLLLVLGWYGGQVALTLVGAVVLAAGEFLGRVRFFALGP